MRPFRWRSLHGQKFKQWKCFQLRRYWWAWWALRSISSSSSFASSECINYFSTFHLKNIIFRLNPRLNCVISLCVSVLFILLTFSYPFLPGELKLMEMENINEGMVKLYFLFFIFICMSQTVPRSKKKLARKFAQSEWSLLVLFCYLLG